MSDLAQQKVLLREEMKARRAKLFARHSDAGSALRDLFLKHIHLPPRAVVASFLSFGSEINIAPLTEQLQQMGHMTAMPVVTAKGQPLLFRRADARAKFVTTTFGIREPAPTEPEIEPDVLLVPFLAFDKQLYRLGYGGGYYDCTLAVLRGKKSISAIGVGFAGQEVPAVPHNEGDMRLDKIVTEIQFFPC